MKPCKFRVTDKCKCEESSQLFCFGECACFEPRETIIDIIARLNSETWRDREEVRTEIGQHLSELRKALEQQPCDDCVSREAVNDLIDTCNSDGLKGIFCSYDDGERFKKYIKELPPVTPTRKVGKWIYDKTSQNWRCSECNETPKTLGYVGTADFMEKEFVFCNHCGAEMRGSEDGSN